MSTNTIKEVSQFMTVTQIRKIAQDSLAPLVAKIQEQVNKVAIQAMQMRKGQQRIKNLQKTQSFIEINIKQITKSITDIKSQIEQLKNQDKKNAMACINGIESLKDQITLIKKSEKRKQQRIKQAVDKSNLVSKNFQQHQSKTHSAIEKIKGKLAQVYSQTLQKVQNSQKQKQQTMRIIDNTLKKLTRQKQLSQQKFKLLDLYIHQRQENNKKIGQILARLQQTPTLQQILTIQEQVDQSMKSIQKADSVLNQMPNKADLAQMKRTIEEVQQKVEDFARILQLQLQVQSIKRYLDQDKSKQKGNHVQIQTILGQIQQKLQDLRNKKSQQSIDQLKTNNQKFHFIEKKIDNFHKIFQTRINEASQKALNELKDITKDFPQRENKLKKQLVAEISAISEKVSARCEKIQDLGSNLQEQLSLFAHKISKMKSDNELHQQNMSKQLRGLNKNKIQVDIKLKKIGGILSGIAQIISVSNSISLYQEAQKLNQKLVFVTYNDGIVCQIQSQGSENYLTYRRKLVNPFELRKCLMTSMIQFMDRVITNDSFLEWKEQRPSDFFKDQIFQHYSVFLQKSIRKNISKNTPSLKRISAQPQLKLNSIRQASDNIQPFAQPINIYAENQMRKSIEQEKQLSQSKQKQKEFIIRQSSQLMLPRNNSHSKHSSLVEQNSVLIRSRGDSKTIQHGSNNKSGGQKNYQIKMKKQDKQRYEKIYTSRSGRYSRMAYKG